MGINITFAYKLDSLRKTRRLTVTELAKLAGVSQPLISNLIHGRESIGEYTARKIGTVLQLHGQELEDFVYLAINDCTEKVLHSSKAFPAQILNIVAGELNALGILPTRITRCVMNSNGWRHRPAQLLQGIFASHQEAQLMENPRDVLIT